MASDLYINLPVDCQSIRLLRFPKFSFRKPLLIECELFVASLPCDPLTPWLDFKALSYAWRELHPRSNLRQTGTIRCNGVKVDIPRNLHNALGHLQRAYDTPLVLWVDYLCINQSNVTERNVQVALMRQIFSHSSEVLIWLGEPTTKHRGYRSEGHPPVRWEGDSRDSVMLRNYRDSYPIGDVIDRAWWERTWVVQECALAKKATIHYGYMSASWDMFSRATKFYSDSRLSSDLPRASPNDALLKLSLAVSRIDSIRESLRQNEELQPLQILWRFRTTQATDPRDKVFGFLGLLSEPFMLPDYNMTRNGVYVVAALSIIRSTKNLSVLNGTTYSMRSGLPSWCPDWSCPSDEWRRLKCLDTYQASNHMPSFMIRSHHPPDVPPILEVLGVFVDQVKYVVNEPAPLDGGFHGFRNIMVYWEDAIRRELGFEGTLTAGNNHKPTWKPCLPQEKWVEQGYAEAFVRTLYGDPRDIHDSAAGTGTTQKMTKSDIEQLYMSFFGPNESGGLSRSRSTNKGNRVFNHVKLQTSNRAQNQFYEAMRTLVAGRQMFITQSGRIGVGPSGCQVGDRVAVTSGSRVPFLLRRRHRPIKCEDSVMILHGKAPDDDSGLESRRCDAPHSCHVVVGDAYIQGLMDGEAADLNVPGEMIFLG
ncbi:heterokaryon incompatibility protein-domain-containing protein [Xylariaceae sp. FL1272]|nr:heterokaryon incompatibility protein-domain-containing protein [Xylariaceae sp. FL1272]